MDRLSFNGKDFCFYSGTCNGDISDVLYNGDFYIDSESVKLLELLIADNPLYTLRVTDMECFWYHTYTFKREVEPALIEELEALNTRYEKAIEDAKNLKRQLSQLTYKIKEHNELPWFMRIERIVMNNG